MLCVVAPGDVDAVLALCERWEVNGAAIGEVTAGGPPARARRRAAARRHARVGRWSTTARCMTSRRPSRAGPLYAAPAAIARAGAGARETLLALLASPNIASRRPLFERYDAIVQSRTVRRPEQADAAVLALPDGGALAVEHRRQRPARRG